MKVALYQQFAVEWLLVKSTLCKQITEECLLVKKLNTSKPLWKNCWRIVFYISKSLWGGCLWKGLSCTWNNIVLLRYKTVKYCLAEVQVRALLLCSILKKKKKSKLILSRKNTIIRILSSFFSFLFFFSFFFFLTYTYQQFNKYIFLQTSNSFIYPQVLWQKFRALLKVTYSI